MREFFKTIVDTMFEKIKDINKNKVDVMDNTSDVTYPSCKAVYEYMMKNHMDTLYKNYINYTPNMEGCGAVVLEYEKIVFLPDYMIDKLKESVLKNDFSNFRVTIFGDTLPRENVVKMISNDGHDLLLRLYYTRDNYNGRRSFDIHIYDMKCAKLVLEENVSHSHGYQPGTVVRLLYIPTMNTISKIPKHSVYSLTDVIHLYFTRNYYSNGGCYLRMEESSVYDVMDAVLKGLSIKIIEIDDKTKDKVADIILTDIRRDELGKVILILKEYTYGYNQYDNFTTSEKTFELEEGNNEIKVIT